MYSIVVIYSCRPTTFLKLRISLILTSTRDVLLSLIANPDSSTLKTYSEEYYFSRNRSVSAIK